MLAIYMWNELRIHLSIQYGSVDFQIFRRLRHRLLASMSYQNVSLTQNNMKTKVTKSDIIIEKKRNIGLSNGM